MRAKSPRKNINENANSNRHILEQKQREPNQDPNFERRQELRKNASTLQKFIHFEASMKPHINKLTRDIDDIVKQCDDLEAKNLNYIQKIEKEKERKKTLIITDEFKENRAKKVQEIRDLEADLQKLLLEKASFLVKAERMLQED